MNEFNLELIKTQVALTERRATLARALAVAESGGDVTSLPEGATAPDHQYSPVQPAGHGAARSRTVACECREPTPRGASGSKAATQAQLDTEVQRIITLMGNEVDTLEARVRLVSDALDEAGGQTDAASLSSVALHELERRAAADRALCERYLTNSG